MNARDEVESLYRRYVAMVRRRAQCILRDQDAAEDLVHDVFVRFLEHRQRGGTEREIAALLFRMTSNLALNSLRNARTQRRLLEQHHNTLADRGRPGAPSAEQQILLRRALGVVEERSAQVALYYYIDGMSQEEIAELIDIPRRAVGRLLDRFREQALNAVQKA